ncbi:hypothetical protein [Haloarcula onubensis]|uniref:Uncharacterized protein n=1 Tax=Haloarcula onubensis TaxID=2950539 RepID=A0ABU2FVF6_9EURY|nr:hypothetical protein [Halomicroarcula sp. S3CR25-11]MDS0284770.1 hypothetical protein [Halomicroarcula sp. S3CR25-11]
MVTYQFEIDKDEWDEWKNTVPRTKALDERIRELIRADTDGRVSEPREVPSSPPEPQGKDVQTPPEPADTRPNVDYDRLVDVVPGSGDLAERRADEILAMYDVLRERGEAEKDDMLSAVDVEATEYASPDSVWSNMVKGRDTLRELPGVSKPSTGRTTWRYSN